MIGNKQLWGLCVSLLVGFVLGLSFNVDFVKKLRNKIENPLHLFSDVSGKKEVAAPPRAAKNLHLLILGQSNAGNHGLKLYTSEANVINFWKGKYYQAADPLLGGSSLGGSIWVLMAEKLLESTGMDSVTLTVFTVDASSISDWLTNDKIRSGLESTIADLRSISENIDYVLWVQGERDNVLGTARAEYQKQLETFRELLKTRLMISAPMVVGVSTLCRNFSANQELAAGIRNVVSNSQNMLAGPSTDDLGWRYRYDGCHFSQEGQEIVAARWASFLSSTVKSSSVN